MAVMQNEASIYTVVVGVSQFLWADPVSGRSEEESLVPATDASLPFIPCGKWSIPANHLFCKVHHLKIANNITVIYTMII